jgi:2-oxoisovalerate dehydrogenase E1 component beta subunit
MGAYGLRPVAEIQFADYFYPAYDQIVSEAARVRYRSARRFTAPITVRMPCSGGIYSGQTHSQGRSADDARVRPAHRDAVNPYDAKGLLIASIECDDPVIFLEPKRIYNGHSTGITTSRWCRGQACLAEVPEGYYTVPLESAAIIRPGNALACSYGTMVWVSEAAARGPASTRRSSICAASGRWTSTPSSIRSGRPAAA